MGAVSSCYPSTWAFVASRPVARGLCGVRHHGQDSAAVTMIQNGTNGRWWWCGTEDQGR